MAQCTLHNTRITGCSLVTGEHEQHIDNMPEYYNNDPAHLERLKKVIGMGRRFIAGPKTTTADMCHQAAVRLLTEMAVTPASLDAVISVTQTPDYLMPGNAHVIHGKLCLPKHAVALDVGMGCSGFVYGLWLGSMMLASGLKKVLLVAGDTLSKAANPHDRALAPLFGDAGSATLLEYTKDASPSFFSLYSNGSGLKKMYIPAGGYRLPASTATGVETQYEEGCLRSQEDVHMNGFDIFEFTMSEQPGLLREILEYSGKSIADIDYFVMHQANSYIVDTICKKARISKEKAPSASFSHYGNQNSASIPGVLCGTLAQTLRTSTAKVVLQGYGVGLSWGACQTTLDHITCLPPEQYQPAASPETSPENPLQRV